LSGKLGFNQCNLADGFAGYRGLFGDSGGIFITDHRRWHRSQHQGGFDQFRSTFSGFNAIHALEREVGARST